METKQITNPVGQRTKYGFYTPQYFYKLDGAWCRRFDLYKSNSGYTEGEPVSCLGANDLSEIFTGKYDSKCHGCFVGNAHTDARHKYSIK